MACAGCSCSTGKDKNAPGCNGGGCASGGCNRHNTYDWIVAAGIQDAVTYDVVEVSFKNGSRKEFFKNPPYTRTTTGDQVLVESPSGGYDVGKISLTGDLVKLQMRRKRVHSDAKLAAVIRRAHDRDLERLDEMRRVEKEVMVRARVVSRSLDLNMKICDVEFQGDGRKITFYYTANGRVDFRELIRHYAKEFKVKIEMRQIGARQESARIGGLGNCGRELCCSTWLAEFKSVNTAAARYQNLAINQTKLSGMCGRLKCCLNYELDAYVDALEDFPDRAEKLRTQQGLAILVKTDVFKRLMFYTYAENRGKFFSLHVDQVWEVLSLIKQGQMPASLEYIESMKPQVEEEEDDAVLDFENVHDVIQLPIEKRKKKKKKRKNRGESQAASIEKSAMPEPSMGGSENSRSAQRPPQKPSGRQQGGGNRPPQNQPKPEQKQQQRPPQPPKSEGNQPQRPPQNKQHPPQQHPPKNPQNHPPRNNPRGNNPPKKG